MIQVRSYLDIELICTTADARIFHAMKNTINNDFNIPKYQKIPCL